MPRNNAWAQALQTLGMGLLDMDQQGKARKRQDELLSRQDAIRQEDIARQDAVRSEERDWRQKMFDMQQAQAGQTRIDAGATPTQVTSIDTSLPELAPPQAKESAIERAMVSLGGGAPKLSTNLSSPMQFVRNTNEIDPTKSVAFRQAQAVQSMQQDASAQERARQVDALRRSGVGGQRLGVFEATGQLPAEPTPDAGQWASAGGGALFNKVTGELKQGPAGGQEPPKPLPTVITQALTDNQMQIRVIDEALGALGENPGATGLRFAGPDWLNQRMDPTGVGARAALTDIGSMTIKDRSGAAVNAAEWPRISPFIPSVKDTPEAVRTKLQRMRDIIEEENQAMVSNARGSVGPRVGLADAIHSAGIPQGTGQPVLDDGGLRSLLEKYGLEPPGGR